MSSSLDIGPTLGVFKRKHLRDDNRAPRMASLIVFTMFAFIAAALTLSVHTNVPELARATGTITTLNHAYRVESPNDGIISSVRVQEGERVVKNQIVATLDAPDLDREIRTTRQEIERLQYRIASLAKILSHLSNAAENQQTSRVVSDRADEYAASRVYLHELQTEIAHVRAESLKRIIDELEAAYSLMQKRVMEKETAVNRLQKLYASGSVTLVRLEAEKQTLDELRGRLIDAGIELATNRADYAAARDKPLESELALREQTLTELFDLQLQEEALTAQSVNLAERRDELSIRASVDGVIQAVDFPHAGEFVEAGTTLFEIINSDERLVAEIRIGEEDIGHIHVGDHVSIKLNTFDARRFGEVHGAVESLSPNVLSDPASGETYFRGVVRLDQLNIGAGALERPLRVGMSGSAQIVTDERSMLAYLAKPIHRSLEQAFGER
ncbi:MAG: HlyD family type I secretion periplasmic adaptor subunit [Pseudomonadota bacterium]